MTLPLTTFEVMMLLIGVLTFLLFLHIFNKMPDMQKTPKELRVLLALMTSCAVIYGGTKPSGYAHVSIKPDDVTVSNVTFRVMASTNLLNEAVHIQYRFAIDTNWIEAATYQIADTNEIKVVRGCYVDNGSNRFFRAFIEGRPE